MNIFSEVLSALEEMQIPVKEDGFASIPKKHCYAAWTNPESTAGGADEYAVFWEHTVALCISFAERRRAEDRETEKRIEEILRNCGTFKRKRRYDSEMNADTTTYIFEVATDFEEEI